MVKNELPNGYRKAEKICLDGDRKTAIRLNLQAAGIFVGLIVLRAFLGLFFPGIRLLFPGDLLYLSLMIFGVFVGFVAVGIVHELIHALFMRLYGAKGIRFGLKLGLVYTSAPKAYFGVGEYLRVALSPALILSVLLLGASLCFSPQWNLVLYVNFAMHLAGCVGDFYVAKFLSGCSSDTLICDFGAEMKIYREEP